MKLSFTESGWADYLWLQEHDKELLKRTNLLLKDVLRSPFQGIGKPEPLKANLSGHWSRRISTEHRLVYSVSQNEITIISCRFHYQAH
jgi:toxin YoeB